MSSIRLVCPRCGAQYDVPPEVIPPEGRDVQCSNCTETWFQAHPPAQATPRDAGAGAASPPEEDEDALADEDAADEDDAPAITPPPPERSLPPEVTEVFREEREYEARQRARPGPIESQPDLGLPDPSEEDTARRARHARERMAGLHAPKSEVGDPPAFVRTGQGSRRDLLPDVEEISETLRGSDRGDRAGRAAYDEDETAPEPRGRGFRYGFALALVAGAVAMAVYASAPQIAAQAPGAREVLEVYVTLVDQTRLWLEAQATTLQAMLDAP